MTMTNSVMLRYRFRAFVSRTVARWRAWSWRAAVLRRAVLLVNRLEYRWFPVDPLPSVAGKMLAFIPVGRNLGHVILGVRSNRGGFSMGTIEWSNQWGRPRFKPHFDAVFDQQCIAEIYAAMRDFK